MRHIKRQLVWFLFSAWVFLLPMHAGCQDQDGPYKGLKDDDMVQMLKYFPQKVNRWNVPADYFQYLDALVPPGGTITAHNMSTMGYAMRDFLQALRNRSLYGTHIHRDSRQGMLVAYKRDNDQDR